MDDDSVILLERYRNGDPDAAVQLHDRFVHRLIALARSRISHKLSRRVDAEDVVQSVYRSFFAHAEGERYVLERSGDLWRLLSAITINKVLRQVQHHRRKKRSIDEEMSVIKRGDGLGVPVEMLAKDPSPENALAMLEEMEQFMSELVPMHRQVLELRLQGASTEQIADTLSRSERTIRRILEKMRQVLTDRLLQSRHSE